MKPRIDFAATAFLFSLLGWLPLPAAEFPTPINSERDPGGGPLPAEEAARALQVPDGFSTTLFAAEPEVCNPIAAAWDSRGRLWIAENYTYAERSLRFDLRHRDRVLILEDRDGDGRHDRRTVFTDEVQMLTSLEVGHGGVWLMCPPQLLFIPDRDRDDRPDGPAEVKLDGFTVAQENYHNFANGLRWGPDGWLYGRCGGSCPGLIGPPGAPEEERTPLAGGLWRYHPLRGAFETLTTGTTNPWGHDWNEHGQPFFINTVNGHLWHAIPGAHFTRPFMLDPNRRAYELIDHHADHWHFDTGRSWSDSRHGAANEYGGGHAHIGMMIYLGDNWPAEYRGRLFTLNLHGRRANQEILERRGSGYVGRHAPDLLLSGDPWFRGMEITYGPDGGVFLLDWSDTGECHESTGVHRTSGRIFKIVHGRPEPPRHGDLRALRSEALVELHTAENEWYPRQARLVLAERAAAGRDLETAEVRLRELLGTHAAWNVRLRALFTLHAMGRAGEALLREQLEEENEHLRVSAVRLLTDHWPLDGPLGPVAQPGEVTDRTAREAERLLPLLRRLAREDSSALMRLTLAGTLQRLPSTRRAELARDLVTHAEDADDHNLPLLTWYGLIAAAEADPHGLVDVAVACRWPTTRRLIARRLAEEIENRPAPLEQLLELAAERGSAELRSDLLTGIAEALRGWRKAAAPRGWKAFAAAVERDTLPSSRAGVRELSALFGDGRAVEELRRMALDPEAALAARQSALEALIDTRDSELRSICERLLRERHINQTAARGLVLFDDPAAGRLLVGAYRRFRATDRPPILGLLVSRPAFAFPLLEGMEKGEIPRADLTPYHVRQLHGFGDAAISARVTEVWGAVREAPEDKRALIEAWREKLSEEHLAGADLSRGRRLYQRVCGQCHRLYGEGGEIGPDLTGSGRQNLDYLLENILDPSGVVNAEYRMTSLQMADGRVLGGVVLEETPRTVKLLVLTETVVVERSEIEERRPTGQSPMPEGLLETLNEQEVVDLIGYLRYPSQVPLRSAGALGSESPE